MTDRIVRRVRRDCIRSAGSYAKVEITMTKKQALKAVVFLGRFPLASGDGDLHHPDKRGCKGPFYRILCGKRKYD